MAWDSCRVEVERSGDKMCNVNDCAKAQAGIDHRCHDKGWPAGTPFGIYHDDGSLCFCCCSCLAYNTPIETTPGHFKAIQDFIPGDEVRACGLDLQWKPARIDWSSGVEKIDGKTLMIMIRYQTAAGDQTIIATDDHVFLTYDKKLVPAGVIHPNDKLMGADGKPITLIDAHPVTNYTGGVHNVSTGPYKNDVTGHLLNANGLVVADQTIKIALFTRQVAANMLVADLDTRPRVGSEEYLATVSAQAKALLTTPDDWPPGVTLVVPQALFNIPPKSDAYFTAYQARSLRAAKTPRRAIDNNAAVQQMGYLFAQFKAFYPQVLFVLDWGNEVPNAYAFKSFGETFVVLNGGLARILLLSNTGLALVLSHLLARLRLDETSGGQGTSCVGIADYDSFGSFFTRVYDPLQFPALVPQAYKEIKAVFALIKPDPSEIVQNPCKNPELDCRLKAIWAGATLDPLPSCADPTAEGFQLLSAVAGSGGIDVTFNNPVDADSAVTPSNYTLSPEAAITAAVVDPANAAKVRLTVDVKPLGIYVLTVQNVTSDSDVPLEPGRNSVTITSAQKFRR
jgi:hypothetical protein